MAKGKMNECRNLQGARILVVEDEFLIALDIEAALADAGAEIVGPFPILRSALVAAGNQTLSLAVLDIRLNGSTTAGVCEILERRGIPFLFYSGQSLPEVMRARYGEVPLINKPASASALVHAAGTLLNSER